MQLHYSTGTAKHQMGNSYSFITGIRGLMVAAVVAFGTGCAPITPLPGGLPIPSPSGLPGGTGAPSLPGQGNTPSPSPSGESGSSSPGGESSGGGGGTPSSYEPPPGGGGGGLPGGGGQTDSGDGTDSGGDGNGGESEPAWEVLEGGSSEGSADGEWQTSNQLPVPDASGDAGEPGDAGGAATSDTAGTEGGADAELEGALEDFDGEILSEREIVKESAGAGGTASIPLPQEDADSGAGGEDNEGSLAGPRPRSIPSSPPPPHPGSNGIPNDVPDAKDDDIIARQLREAAMQEQDPELREKLWDEYRKYKKG